MKYKRAVVNNKTETAVVEQKVLIIGDASGEDELVASFLREHGFMPIFDDTNGKPDKETVESPNLVLLNLDMLSTASSSKVHQAESYGAPILCTIPIEEAEKSYLISQLGSEDYIFRPYYLEDLLSRIKVLLWRNSKMNAKPVIEKRRLLRRKSDRLMPQPNRHKGHSELLIDDRQKIITIRGRKIKLTPKEYDLFCLLASEVGRVFSSKEIVKHSWTAASDRASVSDVQQYVYLLRKKIEIDPKQPKWIITEKGFGYKLELPIEE
jgi:DNA-binding response OmpR family regulator